MFDKKYLPLKTHSVQLKPDIQTALGIDFLSDHIRCIGILCFGACYHTFLKLLPGGLRSIWHRGLVSGPKDGLKACGDLDFKGLHPFKRLMTIMKPVFARFSCKPALNGSNNSTICSIWVFQTKHQSTQGDLICSFFSGIIPRGQEDYRCLPRSCGWETDST